jgi:hypothetical protein
MLLLLLPRGGALHRDLPVDQGTSWAAAANQPVKEATTKHRCNTTASAVVSCNGGCNEAADQPNPRRQPSRQQDWFVESVPAMHDVTKTSKETSCIPCMHLLQQT